MSINKFQEKIFRTGCGATVLYISAGVFFAGMFYMGCGAGGNQNNGEQAKERPIVTVGDQPINAAAFEKSIEAELEQMRMQSPDIASPDAIPPLTEAQRVAGTLAQGLSGLGYLYLAKQSGIKFTDSLLKGQFDDGMKGAVLQFKMQEAPRLKLSPDASDRDFDAAMAKQKRPTLTSLLDSKRKEFEAGLKDPSIRPGLEMQAASKLYTDSLKSKLAPTDDQLKASYDTYTFKKILFGTDTGATADAQAAKAQADLKSGQTFEQVMARYSKEPAQPGKKVSDNTEQMEASDIDRSPADAPLKSLKPGEVSGVIDDLRGKAIYKLISVKNSAPPDLLKNKSKYVDTYVGPKAETEAAARMKDLLSSKVVTWSSPGYKALFDWYQVYTDFSSKAPLPDRLGPVVEEAKKAVQTNQGYDARAALLAWFAASDNQWSAAGADKVKLRPERIEMLKALTQETSYESLKLELVDLEADAKMPEAGQTLLDATQSNSEYDSYGQKSFQDINTKLQKLKDLKLLSPEQEKKIQDAQDAWVRENDSEEKQKAAAKAAQAEQAKQDAALKAQQLAEQAKAKADAAKAKGAPPAPATTGTTPAPSTSGTPGGIGTPVPVTGGTGTTGSIPAGKKQ